MPDKHYKLTTKGGDRFMLSDREYLDTVNALCDSTAKFIHYSTFIVNTESIESISWVLYESESPVYTVIGEAHA